jgi:hypothetical protein
MYTRLIYLMFFALVLALVGNVQAAQVTWNDGTGDHLWSTPENWDTSAVPTSADWIKVRNGLPGATIASEGAEADKVSVGYDLDSTLTVDGGSLTTVQYLQMGRSDGSGMLNMISGAINVGEDLEVGYGGPGIVNMTGGAIIVGREFTIPQTSTYTAEVNLDGGTIIVDGVLIMSALGSMNITAGTLIIDGDALTYVQGYIDDGLIIGYGGAGAAHVDYDATDDKTTVYAVHALDPQPANGATASAATDTLGWMLPDPNSPASIVTCDVILGTDPNMANLSVNTLVVDGQAVETADIAVVEDEDYYWQITVYDSAFAEPVLVSPVFTFNTRNVAPTADAGDDLETWLADGSRDVILAGIAIDDDGPGPYSYEWEVTSNANDLNPATLDDATLPNATVTLPEAGEYTLALIVNDGADPSAADSIQITVYADSCEHARNQAGFAAFPGDTDGDCDVDMVDLANLSANWLQENYSIE